MFLEGRCGQALDSLRKEEGKVETSSDVVWKLFHASASGRESILKRDLFGCLGSGLLSLAHK